MEGDCIAGILPLNYSAGEMSLKMGSLAFGSAGPALDPDLGHREADAVTEALFDRAMRLARQEKCKAMQVALPLLRPRNSQNRRGVSPLDSWGFGRYRHRHMLSI